jgi:hypothetical protein
VPLLEAVGRIQGPSVTYFVECNCVRHNRYDGSSASQKSYCVRPHVASLS